MGYVKRDAPSAPRLHAKKREEERLAEKRTPLPKPPPIKTEKEKEELRARMKEKYEKKYDIPERILFMALESVLYDEEQANNLITTMIEDDLKRQKVKALVKTSIRLLFGFASDSVFVVIQYLSNSTKMTTNTETEMLSKAAARWRRTRKRELIRQRRASHSSSHNLQC